MNTTTLNMTTLDGGNVIIKKGEGGGATINNQDKVVDITENGTTEVVADSGFTGLGKVIINTNVAGSGGGGNDLYCIIGIPANGLPTHAVARTRFPQLFKVTNSEGKREIMTGTELYYNSLNYNQNPSINESTPVMIPNTKVVLSDGTETTPRMQFENLASKQGIPYTEITKEEFYSLD
jgi:hypothetical protein